MKKNLGSFLLLLFTLSLSASSLCEHTFQVSNKTPYLKEGVEIFFQAKQKDKSAVMFFDLDAQKNPDFELHFIKKEEDQSRHHDKRVRYKYLLYPLKEGNITLTFDFKVSLASDKSTEEFASGSRDVIKPMLTDETKIDLKPLVFDVKGVKKDVDLIGDYTLEHTLTSQEISPYEQANMTYTIKGTGYPSKLTSLLPDIPGVKQFLALENGSFHYAFSADENFSIPAVTIKCFSPKKGSYYTLTAPKQDITVLHKEAKDVLDKSSSLPDSAFNYKTLLPYLNGFLLFIAGYFFAKLNLLSYLRPKQKTEDAFIKAVKKAKDEKSLLQILLAANNKTHTPFIQALEASLYAGKKTSLSKIKEALLKP